MKKNEIIQTPVGTVKWFSLNKVDKFDNYTVDFFLKPLPATLQLIAKMDELAGPKGKKPYEIQANGEYKIKLKVARTGKKKDGKMFVRPSPAIYNQLGQVLTEDEKLKLNVGNETEMRANVELKQYTSFGGGCSVKPVAVQIVRLVEFKPAGDDCGFDAVSISDKNDDNYALVDSKDEDEDSDF